MKTGYYSKVDNKIYWNCECEEYENSGQCRHTVRDLYKK